MPPWPPPPFPMDFTTVPLSEEDWGCQSSSLNGTAINKRPADGDKLLEQIHKKNDRRMETSCFSKCLISAHTKRINDRQVEASCFSKCLKSAHTKRVSPLTPKNPYSSTLNDLRLYSRHYCCPSLCEDSVPFQDCDGRDSHLDSNKPTWTKDYGCFLIIRSLTTVFSISIRTIVVIVITASDPPPSKAADSGETHQIPKLTASVGLHTIKFSGILSKPADLVEFGAIGAGLSASEVREHHLGKKALLGSIS